MQVPPENHGTSSSDDEADVPSRTPPRPPRSPGEAAPRLYTETSAAGGDTIWMYAAQHTLLGDRGDVIALSQHRGREWRV